MMNRMHWEEAVRGLRGARRVVVFTGAGISAESGVPTFRDADGFWKRFPPEQFATWSGLLETAMLDPRAVGEFVLNVIEPIARAVPNAGHVTIAGLERHVETVVVTQNVDGLHQEAGSSEVQEIHGTLFEVVTSRTREVVGGITRAELMVVAERLRRFVDGDVTIEECLNSMQALSAFDWTGGHRPNLVLFHEEMAEPDWSEGCQAAEECDVLLAVGTSGEVYPAALLPERTRLNGGMVVTIDPQRCAGVWLEGKAGVVLPALVREAFGADRRSARE